DDDALLLLQGLYRAHFDEIPIGLPYHAAAPRLLRQTKPADRHFARALADEILQLANRSLPRFCQYSLQDFSNTADRQPNYNNLVDIFAGHLIYSPSQQQQLLECTDTQQRLALLAKALRTECVPS
ncbi:MAG: LON peptidase substrate-binding domain-containing protein, partial [Verrucomicrobiales bacterium]|nr:LON peptidase substrate-binding domain-containing protein [Verrucomicrobiales bacterium]